ncbi:MAG: hypothetical protein BWZ10_02696 [candidate division BRC1 bacterium ADurb.BinA364]|nr:MAG: hypothetical protein BWZ10_02696 [candidate division BRC1 bacterium ADurb.BinA364]
MLIASEVASATATIAMRGSSVVIDAISGIMMFAAEVWLMKLESNTASNMNAASIAMAGASKNVILETIRFDRPELVMPTPSVMPPATRISTSQSISRKSDRSMMPKVVKIMTGISATTAAGTPCKFSVSHNSTTTEKVTTTHARSQVTTSGSGKRISKRSLRGRKMSSSSIQRIASRTRTIGTPKSIQRKNEIGWPSCANMLAATALGGVPIIVPMPPILAANGTARTRAFLNGSRPSNREKIGARIAIIIAVVAVLDMNIENSAVVQITPSKTMLGRVPKGLMKARARRVSSPCFVAATARMNPPKNNTSTGEAIGLRKIW